MRVRKRNEMTIRVASSPSVTVCETEPMKAGFTANHSRSQKHDPKRVNVLADVLVPMLLLPSLLLLLVLLLNWTGQAEAQAMAVAPGSVGTTAVNAVQGSGDGVGIGMVADTSQVDSALQQSGSRAGVVKHGVRRVLLTSNNVADTSMASYLERVRAETVSIQPALGSIFIDSGRLTQMTTDVRAMRPNDLISVVVEENLAASTADTVKNQRASSAQSQISSLIGALHVNNALQNLINQNSANALNAQGASATNSSLTTTFGGQVIAVLPNGMLVIEAARQVEFSQQTQTIILRGLVRPEDISQQNQVLSTAISSLELEVKGKGIVSDYSRRQNVLVRLLQQILIF